MAVRERTLQKGEQVYAVGESPRALYLMHSGLVMLHPAQPVADGTGCAAKSVLIRAPQLFGEEVLTGDTIRTTRAVAQNTSQVVELGAADAQAVIGALPAYLKVIASGLRKKLQRLSRELIAENARHDDRAPGEHLSAQEVSRLVTIVYRAAHVTGKVSRSDGSPTAETSVVWAAFRKYCHWGLGEPPGRIEALFKALEAFGLARLEFIPDPVNPKEMELGSIHFSQIEVLKHLAAFAADCTRGEESMALQKIADPALGAHVQNVFRRLRGVTHA